MSAEKEYQTELLCDQDYFTKAAEAALFAYGSPISFEKLAEAIGARVEDVPKILNAMMPRYKDSAIEVLILGRAAQLVTKNEYAEIVRNTLEIRRSQPLSRAALEVLSIIAYNQPATRALVDKVRGIESPSVILSLCDKGLIEEKGRLDAPGRPMLYGTTPAFLRTFGLESIEDLEQIPELASFTEQINEHKNELLLAEKRESQKTIPGQLALEEAPDTSASEAVVTEADEHSDSEEDPAQPENTGIPETAENTEETHASE